MIAGAIADIAGQVAPIDELRLTPCRIPEHAGDDDRGPHNAVLVVAHKDGCEAQVVLHQSLRPTRLLWRAVGAELAVRLGYARVQRMQRAPARRMEVLGGTA